MGRYEKALDIYTKIHGPIHIDIGNTYQEMAIEEYLKENLPKSLEYAKVPQDYVKKVKALQVFPKPIGCWEYSMQK